MRSASSSSVSGTSAESNSITEVGERGGIRLVGVEREGGETGDGEEVKDADDADDAEEVEEIWTTASGEEGRRRRSPTLFEMRRKYTVQKRASDMRAGQQA